VIGPRLGSALRRTMRIALDRPRAAAWTIVALAAALFALGVAGLAVRHVDAWTHTARGGASMVVYLGEDVDAARAQALAGQLGALPGAEHVELVAQAETARRLRQALGADATLLDGVDPDSLPASIEVTLAPGVGDVAALSPTVRSLRAVPGIDDVVVEDGGSNRVVATLRTVRVAAWGAAALLAVLVVVVVLAAVRVRLDRQGRDREQEVMRLLGAGPAFLGVPTALAGALQGILAAALAAAALWVVLARYGGTLAHALQGAFGPIALTVPSVAQVACFVAAGAALGLLGGGLAGAARAR